MDIVADQTPECTHYWHVASTGLYYEQMLAPRYALGIRKLLSDRGLKPHLNTACIYPTELNGPARTIIVKFE